MKLVGLFLLVLGISIGIASGSNEDEKDLKIALLERQVNDLKGMVDGDSDFSAIDEMERSLQEEGEEPEEVDERGEGKGVKDLLTSLGKSGEKFMLSFKTNGKKKEKDVVIVDDKRLLTTELQKSGNDTEILHFDHRRGVMVCRFSRWRLCNIHKMPAWMRKQNLSKEKDRLRRITANAKRQPLRARETVRTRFVKSNRKIDFSKLGSIIPRLCKNMKTQWMRPSKERAVIQSRKERSLEEFPDVDEPTDDLDERDFYEDYNEDADFDERYFDDENPDLQEYERDVNEFQPLDDDYQTYDEPGLNEYERDFSDEIFDDERSLQEDDPQTADETENEAIDETELGDGNKDDLDLIEKRSSSTSAMYAKGCRRNYECALREVCATNSYKYCCSMGWTCNCVKYCNKSLRTCTKKQGCHYRWNCPTSGR